MINQPESDCVDSPQECGVCVPVLGHCVCVYEDRGLYTNWWMGLSVFDGLGSGELS